MQTRTLSSVALLGILVSSFAVGCGDKGGGQSGSASPNASGAAASKSSDAKLDAKKGTAKYDYEKANAIYKQIFDLKNMDPEDKKVEAMKSKLGPADKTDGDKSIWYAVDKDNTCYEFSASPTKGSGYETVDKAKCGL